MRIYRLCFEKELHGKPIWIDFRRDVLAFENASALFAFYGFRHPQVSQYVVKPERLARALPKDKTPVEMGIKELAINSPLTKQIIEILSRFQSLEKVLLAKQVGYRAYRGSAGADQYFNGFVDSSELREEMIARWAESQVAPEVDERDQRSMCVRLYRSWANEGRAACEHIEESYSAPMSQEKWWGEPRW